MTCSAKENVLDTLRDSYLSTVIRDEILESIAESIVQNLVIEGQRFPKWD